MASYPFTYAGSVTPKTTKYLTSQPLKMDFTGTLDLEATDGGNIKAIEKEFQSQMKKLIEAQLVHLNKWLSERDTVIDDLKAKVEKLKANFPTDPGAATARANAFKELKAVGEKIQSYPQDYETIVGNWAENCREQQGLIAMRLAVKAARVKVFADKSFRVRAGQVVKAILIVAAVALAIAAIVVSAGTTAPIFVALAATGIAISGITGVAQIGKMISDNANMEKRLLANVKKDVDAVVAAFDGVKGKGSALAKHVTELSNLMNIRKDKIIQVENDVTKYKGLVDVYIKDLAKVAGDSTVDAKVVASKSKAVEEMKGKLVAAKTKLDSLKGANVDAQKFLDSLSQLGVALDKISGETPNTVKASLKNHLTNLDNLMNYGNALGGAFSGVSGIHS